MKLLNKKFIALVAIALSVGILFSLVTADSRNITKGNVVVIPDLTVKSGLSLASLTQSTRDNIATRVVNTEFPFNAIAFSWNGVLPDEISVEARFKKESWSEWQTIALDPDNQDENTISSSLIFTPYTNILEYRVTASSPQVLAQVKNFSIQYIDSTKGDSKVSVAAVSQNKNDIKIISRSQWGADETLRYDESGEEAWAREYYTPQRFVIHHTASQDIKDPQAAVRAIYFWHAKSKNWGDIGYNYLIDQNGTIYEGRAGGDGVVGAHAQNNNRKTIGIALIGCFDSTHNECSKDHPVSEATITALNNFIAYKSQQFNIDPQGSSNFNDFKNLSHVSGHTNVGHTYCPGDKIVDQLAEIRTQSSVRLAALPTLANSTPTAQLVGKNKLTAVIDENGNATATVSFKNTGTSTWRGYEDDHVLVSTQAKKLGALGSYRLASVSTQPSIEGFKLNEGNVGPGEVGTFTITLPAQTKTYKYALAWNGKGYFPGTEFEIATVGDAQAQAPALTYQALIELSTIPERIPANTTRNAQIKFYNMGTGTWEAGNTKLVISPISESPDDNLFDQYEYAITQDVAPQTSVTFDVVITGQSKPIEIPHQIQLMRNDVALINFTQTIHVISPYYSTVVKHNFPTAMKTSWRPTVEITFKNEGSENWINPTLKSTDVDGTLSWFFDWSWVDKKTVQVKKATIKPGEEVTFKFRIKPYWKAGTYPHVYKLWTGKQMISINGQELLERQTRVDR